MGYGDSPAGGTIAGLKLRKAPRAKKLPRAKKPKPPCKYGPRTASGRCPKKPRTFRGAIGTSVRSGSSQPVKSYLSNKAQQTAAKAASAGAAVVAKGLLDKWKKARDAAAAAGEAGLAAKLAGALRTPVSALTKGQLGAVVLAGLAAYWITSKILAYPGLKREEKAQQAFELSQAYRAARVEAEHVQGRPLTAGQLAVLATEFRRGLQALGFSTSVLPGSKS